MQNRYPQAMINAWDGKLKVDSDNNAILAAKIAAGRKESDDNTFSGVMIGDWGDSNATSLTKSNTGIWGYHHGEQSFGFKDDGTAFIGKSGFGRLEFDGENGTLSSAFWNGDKGLFMDFDQGYIIMSHTSGGKTNSIILDSDPNDGVPEGKNEPPFKIGDNFNVEWDGTVNSDFGYFTEVDIRRGYICNQQDECQ